MRDKNSRLVYSSDQGRMCPQCGQAQHKGRCKKAAPKATPASSQKHEGYILLSRETKGRKGAGVTLVSNLPGSSDEHKALAKELKKRCGVGGAIKNGVIEVQGDQRAQIKTYLEETHGSKVKLVGG